MKRKLTKFEQMGIIAIIGIALLFFYVKKIYDPEREHLISIKKKHAEISKEVKGLRWACSEDVSFSMRKLKTELSETKSELEEMEYFQKEHIQNIPEILNEVLQMAIISGLIVKSFSPQADKKSGGFLEEDDNALQRERFNLAMKGKFLDLKEFIKRIIRMHPEINIEDINIVKKEMDESLEIKLILCI